MNKNFLIVVIVILLIGVGFFVLTKQNSQSPAFLTNSESQPSPSTNTEQKITLIGTVKRLSNNSDPAQYSYELALNFPFYDKLQSTGNSNVSKVPILSRDKVLQDSIKEYVGKEVAVDGLMAWGLAESRYLEVSRISDMSSWTVYTNKTFGYSLKFPETYQIPAQTEKEISQKEIDSNIVVKRTSDLSGSGVIMVDVSPNNNDMSLENSRETNLKLFGITGPLNSYNFNGYDSLFNKNQLGMNVYIKHGLYLYHVNAPTASQDKEVENIVATFKFINDSTSLNYISAMSILQNVPEIQLLQKDIKRLGRTTFFKAGEENGDVVKIWLYEDADNHITRIDIFNVNIKTKVITVDDVAMISGQETITLNEWKKTVKERFE